MGVLPGRGCKTRAGAKPKRSGLRRLQSAKDARGDRQVAQRPLRNPSACGVTAVARPLHQGPSDPFADTPLYPRRPP